MPATAPLDPALRSQRARIAAFAKAAAYPADELTARARETFLAKFLERVDAAYPGLDDAERERRALALRKQHFTQLAFASAKARRRPHSTENPRVLRLTQGFEEIADAPATTSS